MMNNKVDIINYLVSVLLNDSIIQGITTDIQAGDVDRSVKNGTAVTVTGGTDAIISPLREHVGITIVVHTRSPLRTPSDEAVNTILGAIQTVVNDNRKLGGISRAIVSYESEPYVENEEPTIRTSVISIIYEVLNI